jgi:transposase
MADAELRSHSLLTDERIDRICDLIATTGCTLKAAAARVGISRWTLYDWLKKGKAQSEGPYRQLLDRLEEAKSQSELTLLEQISQAAPRDWKAAAWILERRFPDHYSQRVLVARELERMSDEELDDFIARSIDEAQPLREIGPGGAGEAPEGESEEQPDCIDADYRAADESH